MIRPLDPRAEAERLERFAWQLDARWRVPLLGWRFGWDGVIGLLPGVGDFSAAGAGLWIILRALRARPPLVLAARMMLNWLAHLLVSLVPVVGDLVAMFWKSNQRNIRLFRRWVDSPAATRDDLHRETLGLLLLIPVFALVAFAVATVWLFALWMVVLKFLAP